jgi:hypothetical protein
MNTSFPSTSRLHKHHKGGSKPDKQQQAHHELCHLFPPNASGKRSLAFLRPWADRPFGSQEIVLSTTKRMARRAPGSVSVWGDDRVSRLRGR